MISTLLFWAVNGMMTVRTRKREEGADMRMKRIALLFTAALVAAVFIWPAPSMAAQSKWKKLMNTYRYDDKVNELIFVKCGKGSNAKLYLYKKTENNKWKKTVSCKAFIGQNGLGKKKAGDRKTPKGTFTMTHAFGIKKDPGSKMKYIRVNRHLYWCADKKYYNRMVDLRKKPHKCRGEHLITYKKQYAYAMAFDFNRSCTYGKGSAIFLHCFGDYDYTLGCIAVSKKNMKKILRTCGEGTKICIYRK